MIYDAYGRPAEIQQRSIPRWVVVSYIAFVFVAFVILEVWQHKIHKPRDPHASVSSESFCPTGQTCSAGSITIDPDPRYIDGCSGKFVEFRKSDTPESNFVCWRKDRQAFVRITLEEQ